MRTNVKSLLASRQANFILMRDRGFVFAYVPKVACTNWKCLFRLMNGAEDWLSPTLAHDRQLSGLVHLNPDRRAHANTLMSGELALYAMVRNPYSRILSAYLNKIAPRLVPNHSGIADPFRPQFSRIEQWAKNAGFSELSFLAFLVWLEDSGDSFTLNEHFSPQTDLLRTRYLTYDYVGKIETLASDARILLDKMSCSADFPTQSDVRFPPNHAERKLKQYYGRQESALVRKLYGPDFKAFHYSRQKPL